MTSTRRRNLLVLIRSTVFGLVFFVTGLVRGDIASAIVSLLFFVGFGVILVVGRDEGTQLLRGAGLDERQQLIYSEAMRNSLVAVVIVAVAGSVWESARGEPGIFTLIASVAGTVLIASLLYLRYRR